MEMAGAAKNAVLAAAAAEPHGLNAAGIAAAAVWDECVGYAVKHGADLETFNGLAGVGDLLATVMASGSRNRRAVNCSAGQRPDQIRETIGRASEALDSGPQIAATVAADDLPAEAHSRPRGSPPGESAPMNGLRRSAAPAFEAGGMNHARPEVAGFGIRWRVRPRREINPGVEGRDRSGLRAALPRSPRDVYSYLYYRIGNHPMTPRI